MSFFYVVEDKHNILSFENEVCSIHRSYTATLKISAALWFEERQLRVNFSKVATWKQKETNIRY